MICQICGECDLHKHDCYCSMCGSALLKDDVRLSGRRFFLNLPSPGPYSKGSIEVRNRGQQTLSVYAPHWSEPWVTFDSAYDLLEKEPIAELPANLSNESPLVLHFSIDETLASQSKNPVAKLILRTSAVLHEDMTITATRVPQIAPSVLPLTVNQSQQIIDYEIEGVLEPSLDVVIEGVTSDHDLVEPVVDQHVLRNGVLKLPLRIRLGVPIANKELSTKLRVKLGGLPEPVIWPVCFKFQQPGRLSVDVSPIVTAPLFNVDDPSIVEWAFKNTGDLPVQVRGVELRTTPDEPAVGDISYAKLEILTNSEDRDREHSEYLPAGISRTGMIAPGKSVAGRLTYLPGNQSKGLYPLHLAVICDDPRRLPLDCSFQIQDVPLANLVALDFGTTNSCLGWINPETHRPELIKLETDGRRLQESMPSVIRYRDVRVTPPVYEAGYRPWLSYYDRGTHTQILVNVKRSFGRKAPDRVIILDQPQRSFTPAESAGFIIKDMFRRMEKQVRRRPRLLYATFPPTFSQAQLTTLKEACRLAGLEERNIQLAVSEPVAAAMHYILELRRGRKAGDGAPKAHAQDYFLAVCDSGGGTTDLCLLRVGDRRDNNGKGRIELKLLYAGGSQKFGGNYITEKIVDRFYEEASRDPRYSSEFRNLYPSKARQTGAAGVNYQELWRLAEQVKIACNEPDVSEVSPGKLILKSAAKDMQDAEFELSKISHEDLHEMVKSSTLTLAGALKRAWKAFVETSGEDIPRILLFAGQTSRFKLIRDDIAEGFPGADVVFNPEECKRSVALGALWFAQNEAHVGDVQIDWDGRGQNLCPLRLGVAIAHGNIMRFHEVIPQFASLDDEYVASEGTVGQRKFVQFDVYADHGMTDVIEPGQSLIEQFEEGITVFLPEDVHPEDCYKVTMQFNPVEHCLRLKVVIPGREPEEHMFRPLERLMEQ